MDRGKHRSGHTIVDRLRHLTLALALLAVLALSPFRLVVVTGRSMFPTLQTGETYLMDQFYWKRGGLKRDDIVVVKHGEEKWVKRLIGMPGDVLQLVYDENDWITHVNNVTVNPQLRLREGRVQERQVGPDEIFVIGDNLNRSADSTNQEAGSFKLVDVLGVVRTFTFRREFPFRTPVAQSAGP